MRFGTLFRVYHGRTRESLRLCRFDFARSFSQLQSQSQPERSSFGIAFDIDGVILRGRTPIGNSPQALRKLYEDSGTLRIPFLFLTNGGGIPESKRASELSNLLGLNILPTQVVQGHSPFRNLVNRYENELIVAVGKGEPASVMSEYGFKNVLSIDEYSSNFCNIDPLSRYKSWAIKQEVNKNSNLKEVTRRCNVLSERVQAAFVVSDAVDWSRDIQVLCDILTTGGLPGTERSMHQPPLYFANDDLEYQAEFPSNRLGMGAFRIALEGTFNRIHPTTLQYTSFGKPNPLVFKNAEEILKLLLSSYCNYNVRSNGNTGSHPFKTLYMIGDNPSVDIKGAQQAGHPWFSILTRTGVFKGKKNHPEFPADLVVDTVQEAVDYILEKECAS